MKPKYDHKVKRPKPWTPAIETDIRKTFAKARERLKRTNVTKLKKGAA